MAKKKKDIPINETHGAVLTKSSVFDRLAANKYGVTDPAIYAKQLEAMSLGDLQYHAINVAQIRPGFDRTRLVASLQRHFEDYLFSQHVSKGNRLTQGLTN